MDVVLVLVAAARFVMGVLGRRAGSGRRKAYGFIASLATSPMSSTHAVSAWAELP